ncbi:MAG: ABC-2 family transporter protein [Oscillospiraceae bacterium]|nr:ABC-2 family transporter protein [Oscillospiraceae bacterium]
MKKRGLGFYLRIYFKILTQDLKSKMSYRADFIISTIGMIFTNLAGFAGFWIMFSNFPSIEGFSYYEILFLYGFSLVAITPAQCMFDNNCNLRQQVYSGDFIKYCFRPINLFFYFESEIFDAKGLGQLVFGIVMMAVSYAKLGLSASPLSVFLLIVYLITASLIMIAMQTAGAATCFWTHNSFYVLDLAFKLKDYARYPVTIFSPVFKFLFTFVVPIAFIAYYPSLMILRPGDLPLLSWLSPLAGIISFFLAYKFWMYGARKFNGTGS